MLRRAARLAAFLAPLAPLPALAQATPEQAAALQRQAREWLATTIGPDIKIAPDPVRIAAAGDHYDVTIPLGQAADAPSMTGKMTGTGNGHWTIDDIRLPSPAVFNIHMPPPKTPGAPGGDATSTVTFGEQHQTLTLDTTMLTPSTHTTNLRDMTVSTVGQNFQQRIHVESGAGTTIVSPATDGRVDVAIDSVATGYQIAMTSPTTNDPIDVTMGKVHLAAAIAGLLPDKAAELVRSVAHMNAARQATAAAGAPPAPPKLSREEGAALLQLVASLASGISFDQAMEDFTVKVQGMAGALKRLELGLDSKAEDGKVSARLVLGAEGLTLPDLGLGSTVALIPTKLALKPSVGSVPSAALMQISGKLTDDQGPGDAEIAALFKDGPIQAGIDDFALDVAGASFAGSAKMQVLAPNRVAGTGQITAENIDKLQQALAADPQAKQGVPVLIFLKGIGRMEGARMVWNLAYQDGRLLVNDQDLSALTGGPPPPAARPTPPHPAPAPGRPVLRPAPNRPQQ